LEELEDGENDFFYMVRPYCNKFLTELSKFYEIVIFTAAMQDYADWIVDGIDHRGAVRHRLYRQHCIREAPPQTDGEHEQGFQSIKDLRLLGRDIKKTIIIDNLKENFWSTCPNNGIEIESWYGEDLDDTELMKLIPVLRAIAENEEKDVRKVIKHYRRDLAQYAIDFRGLSPGNAVLDASNGIDPSKLTESEEQEDFAIIQKQSEIQRSLQ
jgi:CTD small phosphatase-like protein 2